MSDPRDPAGEHDDGELERLLRASLSRNAEDAPDAHRMTDRALTRLAEQSSRRQRRPGWRRAGAPLIAAASVAAVVAAGLIGTLIVHERQQASEAAASRSRALMVSQSAGPVSPLHTAPPPGTSSPSTTSPTPTLTPVPAGFRVEDLSYLNEGSIAFAVGRLCPAENSCGGSVVAASQDGGQHWSVRSEGELPAGAITSVRFASPSVGYAFGPSALYRTGDGGVTWRSMDAGGALAVEAANGVAVRLTASAPTCTGGCTYSVSTSDITGDGWKPAALPRAATGTKAFLVRSDADVYLATSSGSTTTLFYSGNDGVNWRQQSLALCAGDFGSAPAALMSLASTTTGAVVALCASRTAASVQVSTTHGAQFTMPATAAPATVATGGTPAVAAFDARTILVSADRLYRSTDGGQHFEPVQFDRGASKANRVVFLGTESGTSARWVCGNGSTIWTSTNTGASWNDFNFS